MGRIWRLRSRQPPAASHGPSASRSVAHAACPVPILTSAHSTARPMPSSSRCRLASLPPTTPTSRWLRSRHPHRAASAAVVSPSVVSNQCRNGVRPAIRASSLGPSGLPVPDREKSNGRGTMPAATDQNSSLRSESRRSTSATTLRSSDSPAAWKVTLQRM